MAKEGIRGSLEINGQSSPGALKRHFYVREKFMRSCQNGPLDKFMRFLFMRPSALCIVMYGAIKFMQYKFM